MLKMQTDYVQMQEQASSKVIRYILNICTYSKLENTGSEKLFQG